MDGFGSELYWYPVCFSILYFVASHCVDLDIRLDRFLWERDLKKGDYKEICSKPPQNISSNGSDIY
jgi:hypothetical protein